MADIERKGWPFFAKPPMLYSPKGDLGSAGEPEGERFLTELWIFRQFASGACFYRKSILFACPPVIDIILYSKRFKSGTESRIIGDRRM
jgi:hypothetical protein